MFKILNIDNLRREKTYDIKIGILASTQVEPIWSLQEEKMGRDYMRSIENVGGLPILCPSRLDKKIIEAYVDLCDGFLVPGGIDVDPICYGEEMHELCEKVNRQEDVIQLAYIEKILEKKKPLLGICRGLQIINVACGGSLYQDISLFKKDALVHRQDIDRTLPCHSVRIEKDTLLHTLLGDEVKVNSMHHQSIKDVGHNLKVSACASDGVIEAIESDDYPFLLAVQWHPENFIRAKKNVMLPLFEEFASQVRKDKERRK